jgi:hypothetical protein
MLRKIYHEHVVPWIPDIAPGGLLSRGGAFLAASTAAFHCKESLHSHRCTPSDTVQRGGDRRNTRVGSGELAL